MKTRLTIFSAATLLVCLLCFSESAIAGSETNSVYEYATLRWAGREETHVIYPGGKVELLGSKFKGVKKPDRADERSYFMNLATNALARQGYELVAMTPDDYVFKRVVKP
jgi:hypothetical protein